jgi:hypothetical protein
MATSKRSKHEAEALLWRAAAALVKYEGPPRASFNDARGEIVEIGGRSYVVLTSGKRRLGVYRIREDGQLRWMRRPPRELRGEDE